MNQNGEYDDALEYIYGLTTLGWKPGLERFSLLCEKLGRPQDSLQIVHIGGTNGKGSTTAMVSSILQSAGYRVGSYYSPYVYDIRERVQTDNQMISREDFSRLINTIRPVAAEIGKTDLGHPTEFEVKTALGLMHFVEQGVDFVVLEVGLGGRLDATNIVSPLVSVITNVTLDHMDRLGNTIPEIAYEKAGIIKEGGHVVTASLDLDAMDVIVRTCRERNAVLWQVTPSDESGTEFRVVHIDDIERAASAPEGWSPGAAGGSMSVAGMLSPHPGINLRMQGGFQYINGATAVAAAEALRTKGVSLPDAAIAEGLANAYIPGRFELLWDNPRLLIDGAHNLDGARKLADALRTRFSYDRLHLVMGMVSGHVQEDVVGTLAPLADCFYATAADSARAASAESVGDVAGRYCPDVCVVEPVEEAVRTAMKRAGENDLVCVTGSFYVLNEVPRPPRKV